MEKTSMLETEILGEKVILRTKCGEMAFPHYVFESMARKLWKNQTDCKMVYGGYGTKKTLFEYTKDEDVTFDGTETGAVFDLGGSSKSGGYFLSKSSSFDKAEFPSSKEGFSAI